ncbi:hypothetical protein AGMMS49546_04510 [Spirochaetia bacterium]|nr:hypothetical protein AGMMS49546_04510 [Spirochaetia bacterium]
MNSTLKTWIAESESWQSFIDLQIPEDARAKYKFLPRADDFYISLMYNCYNILNLPITEINTNEAILIAKGLEIYSLKQKSDHFQGIDINNNMLFAAGLYYLSGYVSSAYILSSLYKEYETNIDIFISSLLRNNINTENPYMNQLKLYFLTGDKNRIDSLYEMIKAAENIEFERNSNAYISCLLAKKILEKILDCNIWLDLLNTKDDIEYWKPYVLHCISKKNPVLSFFPSQRDALKNGILSERTMSLQMPTSSGKTFLTEIIIYNSIKTNNANKILYLTPFRSLAAELKKSLAKDLRSLGIIAKTIYGGNLPSMDERQAIDESNVLISTPEKFMAMESLIPSLDMAYSIVICDEGHLLDDGNRGLQYELLLARMRLHQRNRKFLFISAIVPNMEMVNQWLGGTNETIVKSNYRPTQLDYAFLHKNTNTNYWLDFNPGLPSQFQLYKFLTENDLILQKGTKSFTVSTKAGLTIAAAIKAINQGSVLVFSPQVGGTIGVETLANAAIKQIGFKNDDFLITDSNEDTIIDLINYFSIIFGPEYLLCKSIEKGFIYHHGDFPQFAREIIEDVINNGNIKLIICTTTLTEGINLPIKTIVIHSTKRFNLNVRGKYKDLSIREFKNLVGRAGRAGKELKGLIIVPHQDDFNLIFNVMNDTHIEEIHGNLFNLIKPITKLLTEGRVPLDDELLEEFERSFPNEVEAIDFSLLELLSEEIGIDELLVMVDEIVKNTYSYFQSNVEEKDTLSKICNYRARKFIPYIESQKFKEIKGSSVSLSSYDEIDRNIDFNNDIWFANEISHEDWITFIFDNSIFTLQFYNDILLEFNNKNKVEIDPVALKSILLLWLTGSWYCDISTYTGLDIKVILRLINKLFTYELQSLLSAIIRIAEIRNENIEISQFIINWPKMMQYGLDSQLKLDLLELGLSDRVAIIKLNQYLHNINFNYQSKGELVEFINNNVEIIRNIPTHDIPNISYKNIIDFLDNI